MKKEAHSPDKVVEVATGKGDLAPSCTDLLQASRRVVTMCHSDISCLLVCLTTSVQLAGQEQGTNEQAAVSCDISVLTRSKRSFETHDLQSLWFVISLLPRSRSVLDEAILH
jgi:hypothetical protein